MDRTGVRADPHQIVDAGPRVHGNGLRVGCHGRRAAGGHVDAETVLPRMAVALPQPVPVVAVEVQVGLPAV